MICSISGGRRRTVLAGPALLMVVGPLTALTGHVELQCWWDIHDEAGVLQDWLLGGWQGVGSTGSRDVNHCAPVLRLTASA